jgi:hypothetical protein
MKAAAADQSKLEDMVSLEVVADILNGSEYYFTCCMRIDNEHESTTR